MARCVKSISDINQDMGLTVRHSGLVVAAGWRAKMNKNRLNGTHLNKSIKKAQSVAVKSGLPVEWTKTTRICGMQPHVELWEMAQHA